jgi:NADP-dependent 3-hydroxy acid dehydrogenase YdfG
MSNSSSNGAALITGATSGIGAVAGRLLREHSESMVPPGG